MGGEGSIVEIDETFIGKKEGFEKRRGAGHKNVILSLVQRGGSVRSFHVESTKKSDVLPIIKAHVAKETHVMTDEATQYAKLENEFSEHDVVDHGRMEYAYADRKTGTIITINSAESYYAVFKRGMFEFINGALRNICIGMSQSSISGIPTERSSRLTTANEPTEL